MSRSLRIKRFDFARVGRDLLRCFTARPLLLLTLVVLFWGVEALLFGPLLRLPSEEGGLISYQWLGFFNVPWHLLKTTALLALFLSVSSEKPETLGGLFRRGLVALLPVAVVFIVLEASLFPFAFLPDLIFSLGSGEWTAFDRSHLSEVWITPIMFKLMTLKNGLFLLLATALVAHGRTNLRFARDLWKISRGYRWLVFPLTVAVVWAFQSGFYSVAPGIYWQIYHSLEQLVGESLMPHFMRLMMLVSFLPQLVFVAAIYSELQRINGPSASDTRMSQSAQSS